jgi:pyridoxal phosphate enzyme (YggS family)
LSPSSRAAVDAVRGRIEGACARVGRDPRGVRLVAVSKLFPPESVRELLAAGHRLFGESRVQEALAKISAVGSGPEWHLIGSLQRNKARHAVGAFSLIHSVDSLPLAAEIDRRAAAAGLRQPVLVQLDLAGEATKSGVSEADLPALLDAVVALPGLDLRGLMTIPPPVADPEESRPYFGRLRDLRDQAAGRLRGELPELSMGMSDDFEVAVEEGATLVRVGRRIFGPRPQRGQV